MSASPRSWSVIDAAVSDEAQEAISYGFMESGAIGTETSNSEVGITVRAYFEQQPQVESVRRRLLEALTLYELPPSAILNLNATDIQDRDWLAEWKKSWQPVEVGRFVIAPPWTQVTDAVNQIIIRIEPGMAFGTGTHETTRLCLRAIEKHFNGGSFLDVGTGTGILAIAAAKMFPDARIEALDIDRAAIEIARENAAANCVNDRVGFQIGSVDDQTRSADLVCANLTAPVIIELLPYLLGVTCGRLVLSGVLDSQLELVSSSLLGLGVTAYETDQDGEWVAIVV